MYALPAIVIMYYINYFYSHLNLITVHNNMLILLMNYLFSRIITHPSRPAHIISHAQVKHLNLTLLKNVNSDVYFNKNNHPCLT